MVSFGFTDAPATSMCLMNNVFGKFLDRLVLVFLDGILIYSKNEEEHVEHLRLTLKLLRKHKLYAGLRKRKMIHSDCVLVQIVEQSHCEEQVSFS